MGKDKPEPGAFRKKFSTKSTMRSSTTGYTLRGKNMNALKDTLKKMHSRFDGTLGTNKGNILKLMEVPTDMVLECVDRLVEEGVSKAEAEERGKLDAKREWLAMNTIDFFNEVSLIYGMVEEFHVSVSRQPDYDELVKKRKEGGKLPIAPYNRGFPAGYEYRVQGDDKNADHDANWYCNITMAWIEDNIDNPEVFPEGENDSFPDDFDTNHVPEMFKRMFRIFSIVYNVCWPVVKEYESDKHFNSAFKHFYFFMKRYNLLLNDYDLDAFLKTSVKKKILDLTVLDKEFDKFMKEL
mmetsp:Transcript_11551/g.13266  ORF Transcript_11551/g.13266 Transcript_11551/m.13266 type:complete len:295 (-) Transcript_11551:717-1601(-)|eukprot:CAMPEP_0184029646 /NCGR_PEP_ID=MMETSP0955-20130417/713_1 /TAXON_ID=627963 /ORGANISM="Aplanochytrium sp, Strain PBS07" /LENGTH=294 /DNA_ID=CAMNT_0026314763 /DNA_START=216 /DNA_END=1100 /DNA_ORIENTATION=+